MIRHRIEVEREDDGRWLADVVTVPGVMVYGETREIAIGLASQIAIAALAESRGTSAPPETTRDKVLFRLYVDAMKEIESEVRGAELFEVKS